jgi:CRP-like cAMP-binding protein
VSALKNRKLTQISNYMKEQDIAKPIRDHARRSMAYVFEKKTPFRVAQLMELLPAALRRDTIIESNMDLIDHIPVFRRQNKSTTAYLLQHMRPYYAGPNERIYDHEVGADGVYFIVDGYVKRVYDAACDLQKDDEDEEEEKDGFGTPPVSPSSAERRTSRSASSEKKRLHDQWAFGSYTDDDMLLPACALGPGNFFGHECLVDAEEPANTYMQTATVCKFHVLLASSVAHMLEAHPTLMKRVQLAMLAAHKEQSTFFKKQVQRFEEELGEFRAKIDEGAEASELAQYLSSIRRSDAQLMEELDGESSPSVFIKKGKGAKIAPEAGIDL